MAEEKKETKKPCLAKRILKWIGLMVLSTLIIAALVFQAPWKVTTLLVIILAACTILPKPYRKWFWLSAAGVVVALIIWVFLPDDVEGWKPYTFDEELAAMEAKYAVADEENAATIYNTLLASYDANDFEPNLADADIDFSDLVHSGPWTSEDYPEAAKWLNGHQGTINTLMEAAKREKCLFPIQADPLSIGYTMDRLAPMRRWTYLLICAGNNEIGEANINNGIEKYISVLQMGKHQCQQPTVIDALVGIAIENLALSRINRLIITGEVTEGHISIIEKALANVKHEWRSDFPKFIEHDKLLAKNFWGIYYEVNTKGKIRISPNPMATIRSQCPEETPPLTYWQRIMAKSTTVLGRFCLPATPQKMGKIIDECYEKYYAMAGPDYDWQKQAEKPSSMFRLNYSYLVEYTTGMLEPAYHSIHDIYLRLDADKRCGQIIIALRRYKNKNGSWPGSLEEVKSFAPSETFIDPINNSSFVYKLTEKDFTLYSKGKNNIDEDGQYNSRWDYKNRRQVVEKDDLLIWPSRSRKDKEEKENEQQ